MACPAPRKNADDGCLAFFPLHSQEYHVERSRSHFRPCAEGMTAREHDFGR